MGNSGEQAGRGAPAWPSAEEFIRAWQTSSTLGEVCRKLRMKRAVAKVRAFRYMEEHGVPLKELPVGDVPRGPDWAAMARLAQELAPHSETSPGEVCGTPPC